MPALSFLQFPSVFPFFDIGVVSSIMVEPSQCFQNHMKCGYDEAGDSIGEISGSGGFPWGRLHPSLHGHDIIL